MKNSFKNSCLELRKKDYTLNEIVNATGRPKTSIYFHIKDTPLSKEKVKSIHINSGKRIRKEALKRKGKSRREFKKIERWDKKSVRLLANLLFDGQITKSSLVYHNRSKALIQIVTNNMQTYYKYKPITKMDEKTKVMRISYHNVALAKHFNKKSKELLEKIETMSLELKRIFLKAFFDDEGCIHYDRRSRKKEVRGYQHNRKILELVYNLLKKFDIESKINKNFKEITISRKKNLKKFAKEINFSLGVKINGKRTNSIWKKSLEKRNILKMAIDSYQK